MKETGTCFLRETEGDLVPVAPKRKRKVGRSCCSGLGFSFVHDLVHFM